MMGTCMRLALLQLWRDKGSTLCRVLAMAAILVPLAVLLGLKHGLVSALRENLLSDPRTLEISILSTPEPFTEADFDTIRRRPEVGYLQPDTGSIFTHIGVHPAGTEVTGTGTPYSLIPTSAGDPVLRSGHVEVPMGETIVITQKLAEQLQLKPGDKVCLAAWRNQGRESLQKDFSVAAVLPLRCHAAAAVFAPAEYTLEVRRFLSAGNGIPGIAAELHTGSYTAVVLPPGTGEEVARAMVAYDNGLRVIPASVESGLPEGSRLVCNEKGVILPRGAAQLVDIARGHNCAAYPYNPSLRVHLETADTELEIHTDAGVDGPVYECEVPPTLYVAPGSCAKTEDTVCLISAGGEQSRVYCRLREAEGVTPGHAVATPQLLCLLHTAKKRLLLWDYRTGSVRYPEQAFFCMRLYANSMENTESLLRFMEERGVSCRAQLSTIHRVLQLERSLDNLFLIICFGAGAGALISFAMSLFNEAELHRRHYATVQLLGAGRLSLALIPVVTALAETVAVLLLTFLCYALAAGLISLLMTTENGAPPPCRLELFHVLVFSGICLGTAFLASLAAAAKVLRITPAEILRES